MRTNNRIFIVLLGATLLLVAGATLWQGIATSQVVLAASDDAPTAVVSRAQTAPEGQGQISSPAGVVKGPATYRSRQGECYDVSVREAASCLASSAERVTIEHLYQRRPGPAECFDVPLRETCDR